MKGDGLCLGSGGGGCGFHILDISRLGTDVNDDTDLGIDGDLARDGSVYCRILRTLSSRAVSSPNGRFLNIISKFNSSSTESSRSPLVHINHCNGD